MEASPETEHRITTQSSNSRSSCVIKGNEVGVLRRYLRSPIPYSQSQPAELTDKLPGEKCDVGTLQSTIQQFYALQTAL